MVNRILRDDPSKGDMHNRQGLSLRLLWKAVSDYDMFPIYLLGFTWTLPTHTIGAYLTLTLRSLGFNTFETNLLTIPSSVLLLLQLIFWTWFSERANNRFGVVLFCQIWMLPLLVALAVLPATYSAWSRFALLTMAVGFPYVHAIIVAITSRNAGSVRTRTVGSALYNMAVQASSIISSNVYREDDKPIYRRGNRVLLGITAWNFALIIFIKSYYIWRNKQRDKIWNAMSDEEKQKYLATTTDEGNKRYVFFSLATIYLRFSSPCPFPELLTLSDTNSLGFDLFTDICWNDMQVGFPLRTLMEWN